ncbi:cyclin-A2-3-like [Pyrus ussuriensis x Pyrus communis]|uniref:Cyclin-A2-3-like n=1 Tax=Pyrus ussuriensis x Pyrus communis TaxID=2448454 RepID=A0A5N5I5A3_9ROSA|nr:cyclin-A2-3-like [Pyrus ussuriensis x Pyrus communis]
MMPSPPNLTQNHQLHPTTQAVNIEKKFMNVAKMVMDYHDTAATIFITTKTNRKVYKLRIDE